MKLFNTLTRKLEEFKPIKEGEVGIYSCGPTVYWNQHIGNMYAFTQWDLLVRALRYLDYKVKWVMNITDVGHKTSDEDIGEDKMEKGATREGLSVWEIADKYIQQFLESMDALGIVRPDVLPRATKHVTEQIELIKKIEANGFTYKTKTGIIFDTSKFAKYADFAKLNLEKQNAGSRVEVDPEKKRPWDFLLWVTNQPNHLMQWDSPWGKGFPGWHIECTAMSVKYLGERFDIHTGGKEHIPVHHTNEVAQAFGAFGRQTANYWLHNEWLMFDGQKISKSLGNSILVSDLVEKGFNPLALRYLIMTSHYRTGLNFTWESLEGVQTDLYRLWGKMAVLKKSPEDEKNPLVENQKKMEEEWEEKFIEAISNNLGIPKALAIVHELLDPKVGLDKGRKRNLIKGWDRVLGLNLGEGTMNNVQYIIPDEVQKLADEREKLRKEKKWQEADEIRKQIKNKGYVIEDTDKRYNIKAISN